MPGVLHVSIDKDIFPSGGRYAFLGLGWQICYSLNTVNCNLVKVRTVNNSLVLTKKQLYCCHGDQMKHWCLVNNIHGFFFSEIIKISVKAPWWLFIPTLQDLKLYNIVCLMGCFPATILISTIQWNLNYCLHDVFGSWWQFIKQRQML